MPLIVDEDYDLVDDTPDLDPVIFDATRIHIAQSALGTWGRSPKALQEKIREALLSGGYWRTTVGGHRLEIGSHQMVLSSDGRRCESYSRLSWRREPVSANPIETLDAPLWDREVVDLSPHTVRQFVGRHRVDEDHAVDELFDLLDDAAIRGKQYRGANGNHYLAVDGFTLVLCPDGTTIVNYRTVHVERTPSEVRNKVRSRFGHSRQRSSLNPEEWLTLMAERDRAVSEVAPDSWIPTPQILGVFDPERARITGSIAAHGRSDRAAIIDAVRENLHRAADDGHWTTGEHGRHILQHGERRWLISPDGKGVLGCDPPWSVPPDPG